MSTWEDSDLMSSAQIPGIVKERQQRNLVVQPRMPEDRQELAKTHVVIILQMWLLVQIVKNPCDFGDMSLGILPDRHASDFPKENEEEFPDDHDHKSSKSFFRESWSW